MSVAFRTTVRTAVARAARPPRAAGILPSGLSLRFLNDIPEAVLRRAALTAAVSRDTAFQAARQLSLGARGQGHVNPFSADAPNLVDEEKKYRDAMARTALHEEKEKKGAAPLLCRVPSALCSQVFGRDAEVFRLWQSLLSGRRLIVLHGVDGCGKSVVASAFCDHARRSTRFSCIFWFDANPETQSSPLMAQLKQFYSEVKGRLEADVLLVFDGAANVSDITDLIPPRPGVFLLVTTNVDPPRPSARSAPASQAKVDESPPGVNAAAAAGGGKEEEVALVAHVTVGPLPDDHALIMLRTIDAELSEGEAAAIASAVGNVPSLLNLSSSAVRLRRRRYLMGGPEGGGMPQEQQRSADGSEGGGRGGGGDLMHGGFSAHTLPDTSAAVRDVVRLVSSSMSVSSSRSDVGGAKSAAAAPVLSISKVAAVLVADIVRTIAALSFPAAAVDGGEGRLRTLIATAALMMHTGTITTGSFDAIWLVMGGPPVVMRQEGDTIGTTDFSTTSGGFAPEGDVVAAASETASVEPVLRMFCDAGLLNAPWESEEYAMVPVVKAAVKNHLSQRHQEGAARGEVNIARGSGCGSGCAAAADASGAPWTPLDAGTVAKTLLSQWPRRWRGIGTTAGRHLTNHCVALHRAVAPPWTAAPGGSGNPPPQRRNAQESPPVSMMSLEHVMLLDRCATFLAHVRGTDLEHAASMWLTVFDYYSEQLRRNTLSSPDGTQQRPTPGAEATRVAADLGRLLHMLGDFRAKDVLATALTWTEDMHGERSLQAAVLTAYCERFLLSHSPDVIEKLQRHADTLEAALTAKLPDTPPLSADEALLTKRNWFVLLVAIAKRTEALGKSISEAQWSRMERVGRELQGLAQPTSGTSGATASKASDKASVSTNRR